MDFLRSVLDIAKFKNYLEYKTLQNTYNKFIDDIEQLLLLIIQKKANIKGKIISKAMCNDECCFIKETNGMREIKSVSDWQKLFERPLNSN